jgi:hypothetical protein
MTTKQTEQIEQEWFNLRQTGKILGMDILTVKSLCESEQLAYMKFNASGKSDYKHWRISRKSIDTFCLANTGTK